MQRRKEEEQQRQQQQQQRRRRRRRRQQQQQQQEQQEQQRQQAAWDADDFLRRESVEHGRGKGVVLGDMSIVAVGRAAGEVRAWREEGKVAGELQRKDELISVQRQRARQA